MTNLTLTSDEIIRWRGIALTPVAFRRAIKGEYIIGASGIVRVAEGDTIAAYLILAETSAVTLPVPPAPDFPLILSSDSRC